ncbi:hypothetical protein ABN028_07505 [Actinopolymorpha sp. B17G11]|uniref:hypothetical protein n=1 Tax=Actinopolymorpha sp. B17G11 TaxID=3160861 RepID=UPI0032E38B60
MRAEPGQGIDARPGDRRHAQRGHLPLAVPARAIPERRGWRGLRRGFPRGLRRGFGSLGRRVVRVCAAFGVVAGTLAGVALAMQPAQAAPWDCAFGSGEISNAGPEHGGAGMTAWIPVIAKEDVPPAADPDRAKRGRQANPSDHTLLEVAGPRGLLWSYTPQRVKEDLDEFDTGDPEDNFETKCSIMDASATGLAQMMFSVGGFFGGLTIGVKQLASNEAPFESFYTAQESLLNNLNDKIGVPAVALAVAVTGFWVLTRMQRRSDARETYSGVIASGVIVVIVAAILAGNNYVHITRAVDTYTSEFNSAVMDLAIINKNKDASSACYLPSSSTRSAGNQARPVPDNPQGSLTYNLGKRVSSCMLYEVLLFQPWVNGQFGTERQLKADDLVFDGKDHCPDGQPPAYERPGNVESIEYRCATRPRNPGQQQGRINLAVQQVIAQAMSRNETIDESDGRVVDTDQHLSLWKGVQYKVAQEYEPNYEFWRGTQPTGRMATAIAALFVNLIAFIFVGLLAVLTIFWHAVFLMAWIFLPLIGAIAAFPPARRIVRTVAGIMVQAVFLRCVFGLVLALLLAVLNILQVASGGTVIKIFLMLVATAAIWKLLSALRTGAIAPQIVQEAGQSGMMPSDGALLGRAGQATGGAYRFQRNMRAGARAGGRSAGAAADGLGYARGSREWRAEVRRGRLQGAVTGGRMTTPGGRELVHAEEHAGARAAGETYRSAARQRISEADERRRSDGSESSDERHGKVVEEARRSRGEAMRAARGSRPPGSGSSGSSGSGSGASGGVRSGPRSE